MKNRTEIINSLIKKFNYKTYLEIGCRKNENFNKVNIEKKIGVDPERGGTIRMTSDDFFKLNKENFDIVFIDGLHWSEQVYRDMVNSLVFLNTNGTIVIHDCNPLNYWSQIVPRPKRPKNWNGDVWKSFLKLKSERDKLDMFVVDVDYGCGIIRNGEQKLIEKWNITYQEFEKNKKELLNLISAEEFNKWIEQTNLL